MARVVWFFSMSILVSFTVSYLVCSRFLIILSYFLEIVLKIGTISNSTINEISIMFSYIFFLMIFLCLLCLLFLIFYYVFFLLKKIYLKIK
jgi:hypothetical protein